MKLSRMKGVQRDGNTQDIYSLEVAWNFVEDRRDLFFICNVGLDSSELPPLSDSGFFVGSNTCIGDGLQGVRTSGHQDNIRSSLAARLAIRFPRACKVDIHLGEKECRCLFADHTQSTKLLGYKLETRLTAPIPELAPVMRTVFPSRRETLNRDIGDWEIRRNSGAGKCHGLVYI